MNNLGPVQVSDKVLLIGGATVVVLVVGGLWYAKYKIGQAADAAGDAVTDAADYLAKDGVNITSGKNIPNKIVNGGLQAFGVTGTNDMTGKPNTIGSAAWEGVDTVKGWLGL